MAVDRLTQCDHIVALAKELGISRRLLYTWREPLEPVASDEGPPATSRESTLRHEASRLTLTGRNQLWVADITYIRLKREFVYLAVMLDAYSRKVVGWALDRTLAVRLPIAALTHALAERHPPPGLVHHSDRGVQYASEAYVTLLRAHHMIPSMSRPANPYDNASCESFMKTLKREEVYANTYRDLDHLRANIAVFIEQYYNRVRLHSALGYHSPEEFEQAASSATTATGATMRFFRPRALARAASSARDQATATEAG